MHHYGTRADRQQFRRRKKEVILTHLLLLFAAALVVTMPTQPRGWRGLVPLHSNRADVERVLGISTDSCKCIYKTEDEVILVEYATEQCKSSQTAWNVTRGTVLSIKVAPKKVRRFSELRSDGRDYRRVKDLHTDGVYYFDDKEGKMFEVSYDGVLGAVNYIPAAADAHLRCPSASPKGVASYPPFDQYGEIPFGYEKARLENFAAKLSHDADSIGYVVVYPGSKTRRSVVRRRAQRAKDYVVRVSRLPADRIRIILGERKEKVMTELYLLPAEESPPLSNPK